MKKKNNVDQKNKGSKNRLYKKIKILQRHRKKLERLGRPGKQERQG